MNPRIKRLLKIPLIGFCLFFLSVIWLWFGEGGFARLYRSEAERQSCIERIHRLAKENETLLDEVKLLRTDMKYVESMARRELNLIKENEVIYRFSKEPVLENDKNTFN
ncbi:MAG: septum formation initiator family protein [Deltaproteobacteria bacterium]|uniref:Septum formation initiator family protein n=1 Tax=Candidatus Desulfacyla euxinica TaxID=2841693 RepID=A0A8J6T344_9DELT|nr:septum formation initiator family protein [Candidatus Desulfacyla euxinica]